MKYKTFNDLQWKPRNDMGGKQAIVHFDNGYGASILFGDKFYSNGVDTFEIACIKNNSIVYPEGSSFEEDVRGYCTKEEITQLMKEIQDF